MLRLPNLQPISMPTPQLQYQHQPQQPYNPLNFLASGYLPAPFINTGQPSAPSFVYSAPTATRGYADGASAIEEALSSRSRPQLAPIATRPVAQGLPIPQPTGERLAPSPRRRSIPSEPSPLPSETSPTTGESGNEERVESPTPFINKVRLLLYLAYGSRSDKLGVCAASLSLVESGVRLHPVDRRRAFVRVCGKLARAHHRVRPSLPASQHQLVCPAAQYM